MTPQPEGAPPIANVPQRDRRITGAIVDVFVYVVVLNLFIEYFPSVISETCTLSLLTAVLLKGVLEIVLVAKNHVKSRFRQASTPIGKVGAAVLLWVVLAGSKFVVLEVVDLVFGARVSLGGFVFGDAAHPCAADFARGGASAAGESPAPNLELRRLAQAWIG